ncbi:MAG: hypothetical protein ACRD3B_03995 [Candidatus Sulfotelmatobacter sp.]
MTLLALCLIMQVGLVFGLTGLIWPEKLMPAFGILMFPWRASHRVIRAQGLMIVSAYLALLARIILAGPPSALFS